MTPDQEDSDKTQSCVALSKGTMVSHYRIIEKIGAGGMGEVYLAEDTELGRRVALKFLPPHLCQDEDCRRRFKREAQATARLDHPNLVTVHEVSEYRGRPFFAMQHVEGKSLRDILDTSDLSIDNVINYTIQICEGLSKAHTAGVIHRDIKPSNIIIEADGKPKILDFGLATVQGTTKLTKTGSTLGTIGYMSPEQLKGESGDYRSDLFSLGVILYEMIAGRAPFKEDHEAALIYSILNETPEPLKRFKTDVPSDLQAVVDKALEKDPSLRYQHADGIVSDLKRLLVPTQTPIAAVSARRKNRWQLWMGAGGIAALLVVSGYLISDRLLIGDKSGLAGLDETLWENSIAVLPFRDFSPNKDQEYFCDGMTDAIIGRLSGVEYLKVISMTSVMRYRNPDRDLRKIGRDLEVNTVLEGSIQREGNRVRVRAQLINAADDAHLWSETYDQELKSVFDIQDDISHAIVDAMKIKLFGEDEADVNRRYTENIEAYDFYMRGRHLWSKRTEQDIRKAIEYFERAIELDANYALAYSGLADAWAILYGYTGDVTRTEALANAQEAAEKAIGLDENLAEAHTSLGLILQNKRDLESAEKEYLRAIELNSGYFWAHFWYSALLGDMAKYPDQVREENIAFELNPMSISLISTRIYREIQSFKWKEAEELYQRLIEIEPNRWQSYTRYADFLAKSMGRNEDAIRQCSLAVQINKKAYNNMAFIYEWTGDLDKALWAANKYIESTSDKHDAYETRGEIYALNGMLDSAIASLRKALEIKPDYTLSLRKLGGMYMFRREYAMAESLYQVLASHPDKYTRAAGRRCLAQIPLYQGRFETGLRMLDELEDRARSDSLGTRFQLIGKWTRGFIYLLWLNDPESGISEFEGILGALKGIEPNSALVANSRGLIAYGHAMSGDLNKADQLLRELEKDIENYGPTALDDYRMCAGVIEMEKGNFDTAAVLFQEFYRVSPYFTYRQWIARSYLSAGRIDDALEIYEKIVNRYEPGQAYWPVFGIMTHFYMAQAYEAAGRYEEAVAQYETFLDIWKNADEGVPSIEDAKARLAKLKSES